MVRGGRELGSEPFVVQRIELLEVANGSRQMGLEPSL
jgi:hypothetical protein